MNSIPYDTNKEMIITDGNMSEEIKDSNNSEESKRSVKKDRSNAKYSEADFIALSRDKQLKLAEKYWNGAVAYFDDGTFQFSYTHFAKICQSLGFRKGIVDTMAEDIALDKKEISSGEVLYIEHGKRKNTEIKKLTLSKTTLDKMQQLLGDKLSNVEKSKVIDVLLEQILKQKLEAKKAGQFGIAYRPVAEERLL